jgi:signal transduction histidine kinase
VPRLFDRFTRASPERPAGGTGLGLAIALSYAKAIGGTLRYEPCEPRGARFTFELPP